VGLVNLVAGANGREGPEVREPFLIRELICQKASRANLAEQAIQLLISKPLRSEIKQGLDLLRAKVLATRESPSKIAAQEILDLVACKRS
jgi:lipid A disaccharide synthetase